MRRREFFKVTGGALGLCAAATHVRLATDSPKGNEVRPVKREPAQLKRLLDQMDRKGYQY